MQGEGHKSTEADGYRIAVQENLSRQYTVFSGGEVESKLQKSTAKTCDATECLREIAIAFQGELVGRLAVNPVDNGYVLALEIKNVFDDQTVLSRNIPCKGCDHFMVIHELKTLDLNQNSSVGGVSFASAPAMPGAIVTPGIERITPRVSGNRQSNVAILIIDSVPSGAEVYLGRLKAGVTPYQNSGLRPGQSLDVTLKLPDYHDKRLQMQLVGGFNEVEAVPLAPAFGVLEIDSEPRGASITLAGRKVGVTPFRDDRYPSGDYLVSLEYPLHSALENQTVSVRDGQTTRERYRLPANFGTFEIETEPEDARVSLVDGEGKTVASYVASERDGPLKLPSGLYQLKVDKPGYDSLQFRVGIVNGQHQSIGAHQATLVQQVGELFVTTSPYRKGAMVKVDGERVGIVPAQLILPVGHHRVSVESGGATGQMDIEVVLHESRSLEIPLQGLRPSISSKDEDEGVSWWVYALGAVVIGAVASGGGDGGTPPSSTPERVDVPLEW